ncbi:hypothetical protein AARAC_002215 [Aspergillus arachidicola]|uniref:Secreted protein n=1 Tax=Aspergillus arachidicola TaxID=656916 RepID=A0A2G7FMZ8_9EURO|nr:hypothetical protein AARAC_002215 [Aspergillus arachidicola]
MQITSVAIVLFAAMGALSKFGGECSLKHNTCTYLKGGKNHVVNCGSADNQKVNSDTIPGQLICSYHLIIIYSARRSATTVNTMTTTRRLTARPQFEPMIQFRKKLNPWLF